MRIHKCLLCESDDLFSLSKYERDHLVKCRKCSFVFAGQIPGQQELEECYKKYPRRNTISAITLRRYTENLQLFEEFRQNNKILDVGAGNGWFLQEAIAQGWKGYGTEFEDRAVENCRKKGIPMHSGVLDADNYEPASFDVITSFEVIEHIQNPGEEFQAFHKLLRPGGIVYVTTPNFNSLSRKLLNGKWNIINYPEHLSYYTPVSIKSAFENAGFSQVSLKTTGISVDRLKNSLISPNAKKRQRIGNPSNVKKPYYDEGLRKVTEHWLGKYLKSSVNKVLQITQSGDTIKAIFRK